MVHVPPHDLGKEVSVFSMADTIPVMWRREGRAHKQIWRNRGTNPSLILKITSTFSEIMNEVEVALNAIHVKSYSNSRKSTKAT